MKFSTRIILFYSKILIGFAYIKLFRCFKEHEKATDFLD